MKTQEMTQQMTEKVTERAKELLNIPEVSREYQSKESEEAAQMWILRQALFSLMYSPAEREKMLQSK